MSVIVRARAGGARTICSRLNARAEKRRRGRQAEPELRQVRVCGLGKRF